VTPESAIESATVGVRVGLGVGSGVAPVVPLSTNHCKKLQTVVTDANFHAQFGYRSAAHASGRFGG